MRASSSAIGARVARARAPRCAPPSRGAERAHAALERLGRGALPRPGARALRAREAARVPGEALPPRARAPLRLRRSHPRGGGGDAGRARCAWRRRLAAERAPAARRGAPGRPGASRVQRGRARARGLALARAEVLGPGARIARTRHRARRGATLWLRDGVARPRARERRDRARAERPVSGARRNAPARPDRASGAIPASGARRRLSGRAGPALDGVALSLYRGLFAACAEEMGATLMRAAHSPNITERLDHSCAVFDARARLVAQAAHIPVHLGSMPRAVEATLARGPFRPGDAVLLNDPFAGGTHLPDLTLVSPVFLPGEPRAVVLRREPRAPRRRGRRGARLAADRARGLRGGHTHSARVPAARGPRVRGRDGAAARQRAHAGGAARRPCRAAGRAGDRRGAARRARAPRGRRGARCAHRARSRRRRARQARVAFARLPRGRWRFADVLDDDGLGTRDLAIVASRSRWTAAARALDFTGTAPQARGPGQRGAGGDARGVPVRRALRAGRGSRGERRPAAHGGRARARGQRREPAAAGGGRGGQRGDVAAHRGRGARARSRARCPAGCPPRAAAP